jgi:hypothetical protein
MSYKFKSSTITIRREKRLEERRRANNKKEKECMNTHIWSDDDTQESLEDLYRSFFKIKNIQVALKEKIEDETEENEEEQIIIDKDIIDACDNEVQEEILDFLPCENEFIGKKINRNEQENLNNEILYETFEEALGPQPIKVEFDLKDERKFYAGTGLKRDEAELFSHYVQQGKRIPRRGEVGLSSDEIERYEKLGYVMSGSRHRKMNLARMKKEQLVYTAEEKRALAIYNLEEQQRRERNIINEMKYMWQNKKEDTGEDEDQ